MPFGGVAVVARDTGRTLMIQRAQTDDDPAGGTWEFPGGCVEDGETCLQGSVREWEEETGLELPGAAELIAVWNATNGSYRGHVFAIPTETDLDLRDRDHTVDPDGDYFEALTWWAPEDMAVNPALRQELKNDIALVQRALPGIVLKAYVTVAEAKAAAPKVCPCCGGAGEHPETGLECYGCDGGGGVEGYSGPVPCDGWFGLGAGAQIVERCESAEEAQSLIATDVFDASEYKAVGDRIVRKIADETGHNSDGPSPTMTAQQLSQHLHEVHQIDMPLSHDRDELDHFHTRDHDAEGECGAHERVVKVAKLSKPDSNYRKATVSGENCRVCRFMNDDGTCEKVVGIVKPDMVCDLFASPPLSKAADDSPLWEDFHRHTDRIVDHYTPLIQEAMAGVLSPEVVQQAISRAREEAEAHRRHRREVESAVAAEARNQSGSPVLTAAIVLAIMTIVRRILRDAPRNTRNLDQVISELYGDGILQGAHEAAQATGPEAKLPSGVAEAAAALPSDYWSNWTPGHGGGAASVAEGGLAQLLRDRGIWIKEMTETQVARIGNAIEQAIRNGIPLEQTAAIIDEIVHDHRRARLIAENEYTRAFGAAQMATYRANNVWGLAWLHQPGACARCMENVAASPIPIDGSWPQGPLPVHPHDRCAVAPVVIPPKG
jgi:ADP-ribose pyrophosphatase YjhB (NUDIX family)